MLAFSPTKEFNYFLTKTHRSNEKPKIRFRDYITFFAILKKLGDEYHEENDNGYERWTTWRIGNRSFETHKTIVICSLADEDSLKEQEIV